MGYRKADEILPSEIIELIQQYVDGETIYIPRKSEHRRTWGSETTTKQELHNRNQKIYSDYLRGICVSELAANYYLSPKTIQRIIREHRV